MQSNAARAPRNRDIPVAPKQPRSSSGRALAF
jgi:hypothetical protein